MNCSTNRRRPGNTSFVRYKLGLSQQQLADTLGVSRSLIAMVETGKRKFPKSVTDIYLAMCKSAAVINPEGDIRIKRGRKPARHFSIVTNSGNSADKSRSEVLAAWLKQKKETLSYLHTGLQFKKEAAEERGHELSIRLTCVTAMQNVSKGLLDKLPAGQLRDRHELRSAVLNARQIKLKQQLKKCGPVALLQIQYEMNILQRQITMTEERIAALNNAEGRSIAAAVKAA